MFGKATASLHKHHNKLRQLGIIGLSDRQVRRIEQGDGNTKFDTLFAKAHGIELETYLDALADAIANISKIT